MAYAHSPFAAHGPEPGGDPPVPGTRPTRPLTTYEFAAPDLKEGLNKNSLQPKTGGKHVTPSPLHRVERHVMGGRMIRTIMAVAAGLSFAPAAYAAFSIVPSEWKSEPLPAIANATNGNGWYFCPDSNSNPRIVVKATAQNATSNHQLVSGGPPTWTAGAVSNLGAINKQGVFIPRQGGGGFLVAPHSIAGSSLATEGIKVASFAPNGTATLEMADDNEGTYTGVSADLDDDGVTLHVGYIWNGSTLCYARRNGPNDWIFTSTLLPGTIQDTAITCNGNEVLLYYCSTNSNVRSLWRAKPAVAPDNILRIYWGANPVVRLEDFVGATLCGGRAGSTGSVYYFGAETAGSTSWKFKMIRGTATATSLETVGNVSPASIRIASGPDNLQRVAWYNETNKRIHYYRPPSAAADIPQPIGFPIQLTGNIPNADLLGLHFGPGGTPFILYRTSAVAAYVAFPTDNFDLDGNGRPDLLDSAFGSSTAAPLTLPVAAAAQGVDNSANRFKIQFPTVGSAASNGLGAVVTSDRNIKYSFEVSTDLVSWTPITTGAGISFTQTSSSDSGTGEARTFVGVLPGDEPATNPTRFARLSVTRTPYPY